MTKWKISLSQSILWGNKGWCERLRQLLREVASIYFWGLWPIKSNLVVYVRPSSWIDFWELGFPHLRRLRWYGRDRSKTKFVGPNGEIVTVVTTFLLTWTISIFITATETMLWVLMLVSNPCSQCIWFEPMFPIFLQTRTTSHLLQHLARRLRSYDTFIRSRRPNSCVCTSVQLRCTVWKSSLSFSLIILIVFLHDGKPNQILFSMMWMLPYPTLPQEQFFFHAISFVYWQLPMKVSVDM